MADLSALVPLVRELKAAGYSDAEIPGIIQQLHAHFIAPYEQAATPTTQQVVNVAGGYGLLSPMIDIARTALSGYEAALQARTGAMVPAANVLATLLSIQQNPFAIVPALATYGQLGGTPNQAAAFLLARGGEPLPPIYGSIVDELIKEFLQMVKERPEPPHFDPSQWTMAPQNAQPATTLTPEQERLIREAYARDPVAAEIFFREAARNPEGVRRVVEAAEENLRRVREAYARDPEAAERFFREAARNPEGVRRMFGGYARGGTLITDEPMLGVGAYSGMPRFIVGEEGPEKLDIRPLNRKRAAKQRVELLLRTPMAPGVRTPEPTLRAPSSEPQPVPIRPIVMPSPEPQPIPVRPIVMPSPAPQPDLTRPIVFPSPGPQPIPIRPIVFPSPAPRPVFRFPPGLNPLWRLRRGLPLPKPVRDILLGILPIRAFAHGGSAISLPPGFQFEGGRLTYRDPRITSKHQPGLRVVSSITESDVRQNPRRLENFIADTLRTQRWLDSGGKLSFSPGTRKALRALSRANFQFGDLASHLASAASQESESPPTESAPPPSEVAPTEGASSPEPPHVAAARLLGAALRGHTMFAPEFVSALEAGQLPTFLPSYPAFATLSPVLQEALLGYLTQASGGALTREQILGSIMQSAPRGWGF